jgi:hypothetical protein
MMTKSKVMCLGCYYNSYNHSQKSGCWSYEKAKVVKRVQVTSHEMPPYSKSRAREVLSCYHVKGYAFVELSDERVK